jgi:hypothetical protein
MKTKHLLLLVLIAFALGSCSSAYRTGQTPDDVYYSPAPPPPVEYVRTDNQQDKDTYAYNNTYNSEDLAIRRGISDPRYRSNISLDFGHGYNPYDYYGSPFYSPYSSYYNPYSYTGVTFFPYNYNPYSYYSPFNYYYYSPVYFSKYSSPVSNYSGPRTFNLGAYNNNVNTNRVYNHQVQPVTNNTVPVRTFSAPSQPANRSSGVGNFIRRVFAPSNNDTRSFNNDNSSNNNSSPTRSSGSSSSSSSSSGSSAPVRTFRK